MLKQGPYALNPEWGDTRFPHPDLALDDPDGLLAVGGDLSTERLLAAYHQGIFPWFSEGQPILWWSPDPRAVFLLDEVVFKKSLRKVLRQRPFSVTMDRAFTKVISACSEPRGDDNGTWITEPMKMAYIQLHQSGFAHSVEVWHDRVLVGGLYGVSLGKLFFGESMFSRMSNTSKIAFAHLVEQLKRWQFIAIDAQLHSEHIASLGSIDLPRDDFLDLLDQYAEPMNQHQGSWSLDPAVILQW